MNRSASLEKKKQPLVLEKKTIFFIFLLLFY